MSERTTEAQFAALQQRLVGAPTLDEVGRLGHATVVGLSSVDLGARFAAENDLASLETRYLYLLLLLRRPGARVAVVTSDRVPEWHVEYLLDLARAPRDARARLALIGLDDLSARPLADKVLDRADVRLEISTFVGSAETAFVAAFKVSRAERDLALALDLPIQGIDHRFAVHGSKTGARTLFAHEGVPMPDGEQGLFGRSEIVAALTRLRAAKPELQAAVVKLDEGTTGSGNAVISLEHLPAPGTAAELPAVDRRLDELSDSYLSELEEGAIVEEHLGGLELRSPSAQVRIRGDGTVAVVATHEQLLGGPHGHSYTGCRFPADRAYAGAIAAAGAAVGRRLARAGAVGRFALDFVVVRQPGGDWRAYALEINLREGGTTHPHGALVSLTDGTYDPVSATFRTAAGRRRCYRATDSLRAESLRGLDGTRLIAAAREQGISYDPASERGVVYLMLRSLPLEGRLGLIAIGADQADCDRLYAATERLLGRLAPKPPERSAIEPRRATGGPITEGMGMTSRAVR